MERYSLNGDWQLVHFPEGTQPVASPEDLWGLGLEAIPACVPGNVELDLVRAGMLDEPFCGTNIHQLRPYEFEEWWLWRDFEGPAQGDEADWSLVFEGLDTIGTVWLNGVEVGQSTNMLVEHRFDVSKVLRCGAVNRVVVRLGSAVQYARQFRYDAGAVGAEHRDEGLYVRKAAHMYGWDIMPRAVSAGIWRPVWLEARGVHAFEQMYYWTVETHGDGATLGARFQFRTDARELDGFHVRFRGECGSHVFAFDWPVEFVADVCHIPVPGALLWWPKGYGDAHVYTVTATLCRGDEALAERVDRVGLRTVRVERSEGAGGAWQPGVKKDGRYDEEPDAAHRFLFVVNGVRIQVRGSNWVPLDAFHGRDGERLDRALDLFDDLGCNMIRCWGGGVYETDQFFDRCDAQGMLVWQDFAFACGRYPQTEDFLANVRVEAERVVERLRNHASLAIWCGDNEIDASYGWAGGLDPAQNRISREVLPRVVQRLDPYRHYVPSSPYVGTGCEGETAEQHLWGPRGYYKSAFYTHHSAHFIGEIGYHGCPNVSSIDRFISPEHRWPWQGNAEWRVHDTYHWRHAGIDRDRIQLMANQIREVFGGIPDDLEDFALASQMVQAEAKKFFIESARMRKWRTSGILWWNVLDGWPQFSDAIVDYYFEKKLAYWYIRRAQLPVLVAVGELGTEKYRPVVVCNDTREVARGTYRVWDGDSGEVLAEGGFDAPGGENWQVGRIRGFHSEQRLYVIEWRVGDAVYGNHYMAGTPPFPLDRCRGWLKVIGSLPMGFDADSVAR